MGWLEAQRKSWGEWTLSPIIISEGLQGSLYLLEPGAKNVLTEGRGAHREAEDITSNEDIWKEV